MNPFYDENFYYNNYNPQFYPNSYYPKPRIKPSLQKSLHYASKTIYTVNQVIPLINQMRPLINNTRNAFHIIQAVNHMNDIDFDEVSRSITPIEEDNKPKDDVSFENMLQ